MTREDPLRSRDPANDHRPETADRDPDSTHSADPELRRVACPCRECPWRRDQPTGRFAPERFASLRGTVAGPNGSAPLSAPLFACHRTPPGVESACAGWLAVEGVGHVGVRLAVVHGRLDPAALTPVSGWPDLYESFDAMCHANQERPPTSPT